MSVSIEQFSKWGGKKVVCTNFQQQNAQLNTTWRSSADNMTSIRAHNGIHKSTQWHS